MSIKVESNHHHQQYMTSPTKFKSPAKSSLTSTPTKGSPNGTSFAQNFKPVFRACDIGKLCEKNATERQELEFVLGHYPFRKFQQESKNSLPRQFALSIKHKELISSEIKALSSNGELKFNDHDIFARIDQKLDSVEISAASLTPPKSSPARQMSPRAVAASPRASTPQKASPAAPMTPMSSSRKSPSPRSPNNFQASFTEQIEKQKLNRNLLREFESNNNLLLTPSSTPKKEPSSSQQSVASSSTKRKLAFDSASPVKSNGNGSNGSSSEEENSMPRNEQELEAYKSEARKFICLERGTILEKNVIDNFNRIEGTCFAPDGQLIYGDFDDFKICGKVDGIDLDSGSVIEIKTTRNFADVVDNEMFVHKAQCLCYLKLRNCQLCYLVYSGPCGNQKTFLIEWNEEEFEELVLSKLRTLTLKYKQMSEDEFRSKLYKHGLLK